MLPRSVKLTVEDFLLLKRSGAFANFKKAELLYGELSGTLRERDDEPENDDIIPIRLRIQDYAALDRAGALSSYAKTELVDGKVYQMSPQYRAHGFIKDELAYRLRRCLEDLGSSLHVATEQSVELAPYSEPQPDIALTSEPRGPGAIPGKSIALVVEVAVSTVNFDMIDKATIYAQADIPEYWVVDVETGRIHQHWRPGAEGYAERREVALGEQVEAVTIEGLSVQTPAA